MDTTHLEALFRLTSDLLCIVNPEGYFVKVNPAFCRSLGYSEEELYHKPYTHFIHPEDQELTCMHFQQLLQGRPITGYENRYLNRDGKAVWLAWTATSLVDGLICGAAKDITPLKDASQTLAASERKFRSLVQNGYEIISIIGPNGTYTYHSDSLYRVMGYRPEQLIGVSALALIHPDDADKVVKSTIQLKTSNYVNNGIPYRVKAADGTYKWLESSGANMTDDPLIQGIVVNSRDVTEKIQLTQQLHEQEAEKERAISISILKAEERERARIGQELHDNINQRLTAAQLYLEHMQKNEDSRQALLGKTRQVLQSTIQEVRRLSHGMVLSGLEDLQGAVKELAADLFSASKTQCQLHLSCLKESSVADTFKMVLYRIMQEQMTNIAKHAEASLVSVRLSKENGQLELVISDNGKGFDPSEKTRGIGFLGIASRACVYHGELAIEAAPGKGCRLRVSFKENQVIKTGQRIS